MAEIDLTMAEALKEGYRLDTKAAIMTGYLIRPAHEMTVVRAEATLERKG